MTSSTSAHVIEGVIKGFVNVFCVGGNMYNAYWGNEGIEEPHLTAGVWAFSELDADDEDEHMML